MNIYIYFTIIKFISYEKIPTQTPFDWGPILFYFIFKDFPLYITLSTML